MIKGGTRRLVIITVLFVVSSLLAAFWFLYKPVNYLELSFLDVGQGDATLIKTPAGGTVLIDGGPNSKVMRRLSEEIPFWQKKIDLVILTHPHDDHLVGLIDVFKRYKVDNLLITDVSYKSSAYEELLRTARNSYTGIMIYDGKTEILVDNLKIRPLYPLENISGKKYSNLNNSSLVLRASYNDIDFLIMGDAEEIVETELLAKEKNLLNSEVIKLGHHGADTSSGEEFLKAVNPLAATISVGEVNDYGHPSPLILKRLDRLGIKTFLTKDEGTINFATDGHWLKGEKTCLIGSCPL